MTKKEIIFRERRRKATRQKCEHANLLIKYSLWPIASTKYRLEKERIRTILCPDCYLNVSKRYGNGPKPHMQETPWKK